MILLFTVYTLTGQELDFLFVILPFTVYTLVGHGLGFFFFLDEQFKLVFRSGSGSCLQGKWHFKNLPLAGPCWKSHIFSSISSTSVDLVSAFKSLAS